MESDAQIQPQTKPKLFCFVLMPFAPEFDDVYQIGIKEACEKAGAYCERVDEQIFSERILDRIYNQIAKADVVIADMTGRNANVFYEVGYAHALGKPTVLLTHSPDDIPFDLKHFPHIIYESGLSGLRDRLIKTVRWHVDHPTASLADSGFPLDLMVNGISPNKSKVTLYRDPEAPGAFDLSIAVHNLSSHHFGEDAFKLGVIGKGLASVGTGYREAIPRASLSDGREQFIVSARRSLMPGEVQEFKLYFWVEANLVASDQLDKSGQVVFRLFTPSGYRDFQLEWVNELKHN